MEEIRREIRAFNKQPRRSSREEREGSKKRKLISLRSQSNVSIALMRKQCKKENGIKDEEEKRNPASKEPSDLRKKVKGGLPVGILVFFNTLG